MLPLSSVSLYNLLFCYSTIWYHFFIVGLTSNIIIILSHSNQNARHSSPSLSIAMLLNEFGRSWCISWVFTLPIPQLFVHLKVVHYEMPLKDKGESWYILKNNQGHSWNFTGYVTARGKELEKILLVTSSSEGLELEHHITRSHTFLPISK